jgi:hypothetical protein
LVYARSWAGKRYVLTVVFDSESKAVGCVLARYLTDRKTIEED